MFSSIKYRAFIFHDSFNRCCFIEQRSFLVNSNSRSLCCSISTSSEISSESNKSNLKQKDTARFLSDSGAGCQLVGGLGEEPLETDSVQQHRKGGVQQHDQDHRLGAHFIREIIHNFRSWPTHHLDCRSSTVCCRQRKIHLSRDSEKKV